MSLRSEGRRTLALSTCEPRGEAGGGRLTRGRGSGGEDREAGGPRPRIVATMGDPAGIGPAVVLASLCRDEVRRACDVSVACDPGVMEWWSERLSIPFEAGVINVGSAGDVTPGSPSRRGAAAAAAAIVASAEACMTGQADAMVTAPVSKRAICEAGYDFPGHTEFLARKTGAVSFLMLFVDGTRRIALATTHLPLASVAAALSIPLLVEKLTTLNFGLTTSFGIERPKIAVAALNPHGGEGGQFGDEEERIIGPAIEEARVLGIDCDGPFPADTIFVGHGGTSGPGSRFDAILAMYHDQGTIPVKLGGFGGGVNVTLGLPIVRTSADHGPAFDIAASGAAEPGSMVAAVLLASEIASRIAADRGF